MAEKRNIFLEAALQGKPVVENPIELVKGKDAEKQEKIAGKKYKPNKDLEFKVIQEAIQHVGRLPSKVLRYVELMANKLRPVEESYYSSVGTAGGPSRETARKRICRKINQMYVIVLVSFLYSTDNSLKNLLQAMHTNSNARNSYIFAVKNLVRHRLQQLRFRSPHSMKQVPLVPNPPKPWPLTRSNFSKAARVPKKRKIETLIKCIPLNHRVPEALSVPINSWKE